MSAARENPEENEQLEIDPEFQTEILQTYLDQHYRKMLDDKTPRQCAKSSKDKEIVIEWLKYLENNEHHRSAQDGQKPYDTQWMREELNLFEERDE